MKNLIQAIAAIMALLMSGCIGVRREHAAQSWPEPTSATNVIQFVGTFSNRSVDRTTGSPGDHTNQLFDFLTGQGHWHLTQGTHVEIQLSSEAELLRVRLMDGHGEEIDSADLKRGSDFEFSDGFLTLYGPLSGTRVDSGNLGAGIGRQCSRLHIGSPHGLLGQRSESVTGLLFYFVPFATTSQSWMYWPKIATQ